MARSARIAAIAMAVAGCGVALPVLAQTAPEVSEQPWYPEGYLDLRLAAEKQIETFPREDSLLLRVDARNRARTSYELVDCQVRDDLPDGLPVRDLKLSELALDVARMRAELARLGYDPEIYRQPLLDYERATLAEIEEDWSDGAAAPPADDEPEAAPATDLMRLRDALETGRTRLQPNQPRFTADDSCGVFAAAAVVGLFALLRDVATAQAASPSGSTAPRATSYRAPPPIRFSLSPPTGEVWLVNAFAFRVCERKVSDPWNHLSCGWNQYGNGEGTAATGRFMYEARWPDGTVQRGAKVIDMDATGATITFRKN